MIKYEFMRAHGKGSEGSEKKGGCENKKGVRKKGGCTQHRHPPCVRPCETLRFFKHRIKGSNRICNRVKIEEEKVNWDFET